MRKKLLESQASYKRKNDNRLCRDKTIIKPADYEFLRIERKGDKETRHKLEPTAEGWLRVKEVETAIKTVVIERNDM